MPPKNNDVSVTVDNNHSVYMQLRTKDTIQPTLGLEQYHH